MTKVRCSMVMSPNGYIAKPDGDEEWISPVNWTDFVKDAKRCNNLVVGRETFEIVMKLYEDYNFDNVPAEHKLVVTGRRDYRVPSGYVAVHSPKQAVEFLAGQGIETVLLSGGGKLNAAFAEEGLIDELELIVEPYVIGQGRQVLAAGTYEFPLRLLKTEELSEGRVRLLYAVLKESGNGR